MSKTFTDIINTHRGIIYKICNMYCNEKEDKEDLFQEIVLQLWKSYPNFRNEAKISTWMYRVALNTAISNLRQKSRKPKEQAISSSEFQIPDATFFDDDPSLSLLQTAIEHLTKIEKAIIMLYLEEKSYEEMSEIIGITKTNVGAKLNRIKSKLEKIIKSTSYGIN